ncbi:MAG: phenylalanine--tRNA ligase subunit beta [Deinococcaceae bacterium]
MLVPLSWLEEFLPDLYTQYDPSQTSVWAELGLPVESTTCVPGIPEGVLLGHVLSCEPLEDTQLSVLSVDMGSHIVTLVSGAPNAKAGVGIAVAPPGRSLPTGQTLGIRNIQGIESWGMACSPAELGIGTLGTELLLLPLETGYPGTDLSTLWAPDIVLDIEVTPNRADALSLLGIARDLSAYLNLPLYLPSPEDGMPETSAEASFSAKISPETVRVLESDPLKTLRKGCDVFALGKATSVRGGPSPLWIQRKLLLCGQRPINLIVDIGNYVMLELGQPSALYDARDVDGHSLEVCLAEPNEPFIALDKLEHLLDENDLVIRTAHGRVVSLAGIVGSQTGRVREDTRDVFIETAHFDPVMLRKTANRLEIKTDAAYRFERGVDPQLPVTALQRILSLLKTFGQADADPNWVVSGETLETPYLSLDPQHVVDLLGMDISIPEMVSGLTRLGCVVLDQGGVLRVQPPSWRMDLSIPEDLIEEIARLHGFHRLPETLPEWTAPKQQTRMSAISHETVKKALVGLGFFEVISYGFTDDAEAQRAKAPSPNIRLKNPLTSAHTAMRTALYPGLLNAARTNRNAHTLLLFELGHVFLETHEEAHLALLMKGPQSSVSWNRSLDGLSADFYTFKGLLESWGRLLGATITVEQANPAPSHLHPGIAGALFWNGQPQGHIGAVHPEVAQAWGLNGPIWIAELKYPFPEQPWAFADLNRHPAAFRDLAIVAPNGVSYETLRQWLHRDGGMYLSEMEVFDVYSGKPIPPGFRSIAVRLKYQGPHRTLTDEEVQRDFMSLIAKIKSAGFEIRDH